MNNKPNLFLIGSPKTGSTALAKNISQHSQIFLPKYGKERFFDAITYYDYQEDCPVNSLDDFLSSYTSKEATESRYRLDPCALSMYKKESIENILKLSPDAKFIIILRDPVEASISMFHQRLSYVDIPMREVCDDFNKCWNLLEDRKEGKGYPKGCRNKFLFRYDLLYSYQNYLPYLKERLGDNLFIGFYDEYKDTPDMFFDKLFSFLELDAIKIESKKINKSAIVKKTLFLNILNKIAKNTIDIRKKLGLLGLVNIQKNIVSKYRKPIKSVKAEQKVYDFFKPTYEYLESLKNDKYHSPK